MVSLSFLYLLSVCKKVYRDFLRTVSIPVISVIPGLLSFDFRCFRCMAVQYPDISYIAVIYFRSISIYLCNLFYLILYVFSLCLLRKLCPCMSPAISFAKLYFFAYLFIISIKLYFDTLWTLSVLVVCIIPALGYRYTCFFRCIAVFNVMTVNFRSILCYCIFRYGILYLLSFFILRKVGKAVFNIRSTRWGN